MAETTFRARARSGAGQMRPISRKLEFGKKSREEIRELSLEAALPSHERYTRPLLALDGLSCCLIISGMDCTEIGSPNLRLSPPRTARDTVSMVTPSQRAQTKPIAATTTKVAISLSRGQISHSGDFAGTVGLRRGSARLPP